MNKKLFGLALMMGLLGLVGTADAQWGGQHYHHYHPDYHPGYGGYGAASYCPPNCVNPDPAACYWQNYWANLGSYNHIYWPSVGYTANMNNCFNQ